MKHYRLLEDKLSVLIRDTECRGFEAYVNGLKWRAKEIKEELQLQNYELGITFTIPFYSFISISKKEYEISLIRDMLEN